MPSTSGGFMTSAPEAGGAKFSSSISLHLKEVFEEGSKQTNKNSEMKDQNKATIAASMKTLD